MCFATVINASKAVQGEELLIPSTDLWVLLFLEMGALSNKHTAHTCHLQHLQYSVCLTPCTSQKRVLDVVGMGSSSIKDVQVLESSLYLNMLSENNPI